MTINIHGYIVLIDDEDYERVMARGPWHRQNSMTVGPYFGHTMRRPNHKIILLHRFIINAPSGFCVDHISGDAKDNRKCNLRLCTHSENMRNQKKRSTSKNPFKGVSRANSIKEKWDSRIKVNRKQIYLGSFLTPDDAYRAYCEAAKEYHGEFARVE